MVKFQELLQKTATEIKAGAAYTRKAVYEAVAKRPGSYTAGPLYLNIHVSHGRINVSTGLTFHVNEKTL